MKTFIALSFMLAGLTGCVFGPECSADGDCVEGQICDDTLDECVAGCRSDDDCAAEQICNTTLDECEAGCREDEDCPEGQSCDLSRNECEEEPQDASSG